MAVSKKVRIRSLLKSIETGEPGPVSVVNESRYVQHNPQTHEGNEGLAALFSRLSKTEPKVNMVRGFEDGDFVFAHMEYDFASRKICFEVFRFEDDQAVEHWDNIQDRLGPNDSRRSMVDGPTEAGDHALTEQSRSLVRAFVDTVLIGRDIARLGDFVDGDSFAEHNPHSADGVAALHARLTASRNGQPRIEYQTLHRVLAEGNFALSVCEGECDGLHTAFYDLFRVDGGNLVEHWDTTETVAPQSEWKNANGKF
ncbi:nuclear transport factor 2 family protein [Sedimentitalea todarodis]|uniref:Nuclear transport factor 2 family protein n=1 Tax=Sedimentitalea todarodis TaxID=1631240 RepID=A0ABU3V8B0_9RHOB|nr:nuclear transport factor 2 family protein [Sedimentitalea todarodis]MDU9002275.1 nuclear transport factor 2 family protein [Sedimentitalea todarodis]